MKRSATITSTSAAKRTKTTGLNTKKSYVRAPASTRQELKRASTAIIGGASITNAASLFIYPRIAAGDDDDEREGRSIKLKGIQCIGTLESSTPGTIVRVLTFMWNQALTTPTAPDILEAAAIGMFYGTYNISQQNNFSILQDTYITLSDVGPKVKHWTLQKNLNTIQNYFGPALTEQSDKAIWVLLVTNQGAAEATANAAITFIDM